PLGRGRGRRPRGSWVLLRRCEEIDSRRLGAAILIGQVDRVGIAVHGLVPRRLTSCKVLTRVSLSFAGARVELLAGLDRVGLGDVKDGGELANPEASAFLLLAGVRVGLVLTLRGNPGRYLDAMLAAAHLAPERSPSVVSEHVLTRADVGF